MSKPAQGKISFQITISKRVKSDADAIVEAVNQIRAKQGTTKKVTLSNFIEDLIIGFIISNTDAVKPTEANKEENKDA